MIPGNHDVGFYGDEVAPPASPLSPSVATWDADRFTRDLDGPRLVGVDAYLLDTAEHDRWLTARRGGRPARRARR